MLLLNAAYLLAKRFVDERKRVLGGSICSRIVDRIDREEEVASRKVGVKARGAEVLADVLGGVGEGLSDSGRIAIGIEEFRPVLRWPEVEQRSDAGSKSIVFPRSAGVAGIGQQTPAGLRVGDERDIRNTEVLTIPFVVAEEEEAVASQRTAERRAVVVALKLGDPGLVEVVARVKVRVAKKLVCGAVKRVCSGRSDDRDLGSLAIAVACRIGICDDVELAHSIYAEKLTAGSAGRDVDQRCRGVLCSVEQVAIVLWASTRDGEHITD